MNYIDEVKAELAEHIDVGTGLMNVYALLVLVKGEDCTNEDVHDAWAVNVNVGFPEHRSLKPYRELSKETQDKDSKYTLAIRRTAANLFGTKRTDG